MDPDEEVVELARQIHVAMDELARALGEAGYPAWEDAPAWQREASMSSARQALDGGLLPGQEHARWMADKLATGWRWGPDKDDRARTHPMLLPFEDLPIVEQLKDAVPWLVASRFKAALAGGGED